MSSVAEGKTLGDLALLQDYEPIMRYTRGELFLPMAVEAYVSYCSLWSHEAGGEAACLVPAGELTLERLCEVRVAQPTGSLSLRFVREPLSRLDYRHWRREPRERLRATGRFTTTGIFGRVVDAVLRASLLLRGKVAAGLAAAAEIAYREHGEPERRPYYGRVSRDGDYLCLQYWFFYAMNDWRSTFSGVNDHEADWELVVVYLAEQQDAPPRPVWVAASNHEHAGDDMRRRWDDPELGREGDHPLVFVGAGSHSGAFIPGDYVVTIDPAPLRRPIAFARRVSRLVAPWRAQVGATPGFGIPFIDYARGDGIAIGPGQRAGWDPALIDDETPWVRAYRGLWGLDTKDRFGGERAPAGPRYERDGSLRSAWANPLGWAGLLKVPPREEETPDLLRERISALERELSEHDRAIAEERAALRALSVEQRSLESHAYERKLAAACRAAVLDHEARLNEHIATRARLADERHSHLETLSRPLPPIDPQAHLSVRGGPRSEAQTRRTRFLRLWAAVSTPLLIASPIAVLIASPLAWITTIVVLVCLFLGVEAFAHRRFLSFVGSVLLVGGALGALGAIVFLVRHHWRLAVSVALGTAALALLFGNLGDLHHRWRRGSSPSEDE